MRGKGTFNIAGVIMPAVLIGGGAVGAELLMGYLPLPAVLKTGPLRYVTKAAVSVAAGYFIAKYGNKKAGEAFAMGGIAIATHDALKAGVTQFMPGARFGGFNWDKYGYNQIAESYGTQPGIGYYSPGSTMEAGYGEYMGEYNVPMGEYEDFAM